MTGPRRLVESSRFDRFVSVAIVVNAFALGAQTYSSAPWLGVVNGVCMAMFVAELALRVMAYGRTFPDNRWNIFDAVIIGAGLIPGIGPVAQVIRLARVARLIRFLPDAQVLLTGAVKAIPALGSLFAITGLLIFLYGMVAVELFGAAIPDRFGNLGQAALTLFVLLSLENFPDVLYSGMAITPWAVPFFISYALLAAFVVFNLVIGVVISSLEDARGASKGEAADGIAKMRAALDSIESLIGDREAEVKDAPSRL